MGRDIGALKEALALIFGISGAWGAVILDRWSWALTIDTPGSCFYIVPHGRAATREDPIISFVTLRNGMNFLIFISSQSILIVHA
jgi:hypothetical protein